MASAILADNDTKSYGTPEYSFELHLNLCDIDHRRTKPTSLYTVDCVECFIRTIKQEFFEDMCRRKFYVSVYGLQTDLDQ